MDNADMGNIELLGAIHWWLADNCTKNLEVFGKLRALLSHFFYCADSVCLTLKNHPFPAGSTSHGRVVLDGKNNMYFANMLLPSDFLRFRGMLALIGDMCLIIKETQSISASLDNDTLSNLLDKHEPNLQQYRRARNFFAHFDERIGRKMDVHGVTGKLEIPELGLAFGEEAQGCFYLVFSGDSFHYHDKQRGELKASPKSLSLNKDGLSGILDLVRDLYDLITSHTIHARSYPPSSSIYNLD
jgi:hypothetical protein